MEEISEDRAELFELTKENYKKEDFYPLNNSS